MSADDRGSDLFRCEVFIGQFPRGMTRKACLRRQDERRTEVVTLRKGRPEHGIKPKTETRDVGPVNPFCALECAEGRVSRALLAGAELAAPPAEALALAKPAPSTRLWEPGAVPNTPIAPPPATSPFTGFRPRTGHAFTTDAEQLARSMRRKREQFANQVTATLYGEEHELVEEDLEADDGPEEEAPARREAAAVAVQAQPPAREAPAEENTMPRGGAHAACKECGSTTRHKANCSKPPRAAPAAAPVKAAPAEPARRAERRQAPRPSAAKRLGLDLDALAVEDLVELSEAVRAAMVARLAAIDAERERLLTVVGGGEEHRAAVERVA